MIIIYIYIFDWYWSIIRPTATCGCEVWILKENIKNMLMVFDRKVLRNIFGPTKERVGTWSIKTSDYLDELIRHKNVVNHIQAQRLIWFGHLHRMAEERMVKKVYKWKPMSIRPRGRPKNKWENVLTYLGLYFLTLVMYTFRTCCILRCLVCIVVSCLVCIVVVVLCVLL